ncbi:MAG: hypothetical protein AAFV53_08330 [Myxococcota bacterium]
MTKGMLDMMRAVVGRHRHLNIRFTINARYEIALWERPGLWMAAEQRMALVEDLRVVARAGQRGKAVPEYGVLTGEQADLETRVITVAYHREHGHPVGFTAMSYLDIPMGDRVESVLHLGLTFIDPDYQRHGLPSLLYGAAGFLLLFKSGLRGFWVSNVTQIPAIVGMFSENYATVYPHYDHQKRQSFTHLMLARQIMRHHRSVFGVGEDAGFDEARQIITDAYTGGSDELKKSWAAVPRHRNDQVNQYCARWLDYDRGDDFLQLGYASFGSTMRFLGTRLPQGSVPQLFFQAILLFSLAVVMPVVQWLVPPLPEEAS